MDLNGSLFDAINGLAGRSSIADDAMKLAANYAIYVVAAIIVASWFIRTVNDRERRIGAYTALSAAALALAVALAIQQFYVHQRPFVVRGDVNLLIRHSADASFPSEHTTASFGMAGGLWPYRRRLALLAGSFAALTGFARVYVGIHWPADVAGGAAIGLLAAAALYYARPLFAWLDRTLVVRLVPQPLL